MQTDSEDFSAYPQPAWNAPDSVSVALERVSQAHDLESSTSAYHDLLYAVGNDHAGTYYPVVLAVLPRVEMILREGKPWPQHSVLEALIDLLSSFCPEPGYETFRGVQVSDVLQERIIAMKPLLDSLVPSNDILAKSIRDLQTCLDERSA